jgi:hypothetical protein
MDHVSAESIVESADWMVLHRPSEPARLIGRKTKVDLEFCEIPGLNSFNYH